MEAVGRAAVGAVVMGVRRARALAVRGLVAVVLAAVASVAGGAAGAMGPADVAADVAATSRAPVVRLSASSPS